MEYEKFSDKYPLLDLEIRSILENVKLPSKDRVIELLEKSKHKSIELAELAELLKIGEKANTNEQFYAIRKFTIDNFRKDKKNEVRHIAAMYLSSHCTDTCGYCNFSAFKKNTQRTRLSLSELEEEVETAISLGNDVIEFTLATDPEFTPDKLATYIKKTLEMLNGKKGSGVILCSSYMSQKDYEKLKDAGLWGIVQWDETMDKDEYQKWHGTSPKKKNFFERMDNHDRAMKAGLEVATGILFGLGDYRYDVLMQIAKARYLEKENGRKPFVFGAPRIKPIGGRELGMKNVVQDRQYELSLMVYKIAEPEIGRWLQIRETSSLNSRNLLDGDVFTSSCGNTKPGGYKVNVSKIDNLKGGQFKVIELPKADFEQRLAKINFKANYAWIK